MTVLSDFLLRNFPRYDAAAEDADEAHEGHDGEQDPLLRYAVVGIFVILAIGALQAARVIALPITAGVIIGLVLGPLVDKMVRHGVPQHLAAAIVVLAAIAAVLSVLTLLAVPIAAWSDQIPAMMAALRARFGGVLETIKQMESAISSFTGSSGLQVSVGDDRPLMHFALSSSAAAGSVLIFVATTYFYLATRRHLKARLLRLCLGKSTRRSAVAFFEEIEYRVSAYLAVVTAINAGLGLVASIIAWTAGLPFPIFWGAAAFLLNYLVFVGPIIVAVLLFAASLLTSQTTLAAVWPAATFYATHLIESNVVTPAVVGNRLTVSPFLIFISFIFWLWLWGPVGAVLSTPLLLVLMVGLETFAQRRDEAPAARASGTEAE
jgi:predicted PurR-regulated permease PerM